MSGPGALAALRDALPSAWSLATSRHWTRDNPARGQCSVTALVVQDRLGGAILKTRVGPDWHFYNRVDGARLDLTASQFATPVVYDDAPSERDEAMADTLPTRYAALVQALDVAMPERCA